MTDYLAVYSIYRTNTREGMKEKDVRLRIDREHFLSEWCHRDVHYHRISAVDEEHAKEQATFHGEALLRHALDLPAEVTLDELLEVKPVEIKSTEPNFV